MIVNITGSLYGVNFNNEPLSLKGSFRKAYALCVLAYFGLISVECRNRTTEYQIFGKNWDGLNAHVENLYLAYDGLTFEQEKNSLIQGAKCALWNEF